MKENGEQLVCGVVGNCALKVRLAQGHWGQQGWADSSSQAVSPQGPPASWHQPFIPVPVRTVYAPSAASQLFIILLMPLNNSHSPALFSMDIFYPVKTRWH